MHYKKAIQLKPDQPLVHYKLGKTYQAMGARFEAREAFQTVFNLRSQKNGRDSKHPVFPQTMGESSDFEADPVDHVPSVESEW
jgi:hypothetical protein